MSSEVRRIIRSGSNAAPVVLGGVAVAAAIVLGFVAAGTILARVLGHARKYLPNGDGDSSYPRFGTTRGDTIALVLIGVAFGVFSFACLLWRARRRRGDAL